MNDGKPNLAEAFARLVRNRFELAYAIDSYASYERPSDRAPVIASITHDAQET